MLVAYEATETTAGVLEYLQNARDGKTRIGQDNGVPKVKLFA
jgi:hypothetical protein